MAIQSAGPTISWSSAVFCHERGYVSGTCNRNQRTARARAYLIETATPGYTMTRQGPERAIGRLHPEFVRRLAAAIAEARARDCHPPEFSPLIGRLHSALAASPTNFIRSIPMGSPSMLPGSGRLARERSAVARDRRAERRDLSVRAVQPSGMESLPADMGENHPSR